MHDLGSIFIIFVIIIWPGGQAKSAMDIIIYYGKFISKILQIFLIFSIMNI
jgi:hypothetical protein